MVSVQNEKRKFEMRDKIAKYIFFSCAIFSIFAIFGILFYLCNTSIPAFREIGIFNLLFGTVWAPDKEFLAPSDKFGLLPMILSSLCVSFGALLVGGLGGVFTAVFLVRFAPKRIKAPLTAAINFLSGIPSIMFGFFGMVVVVKLLSIISPSGSGYGMLACIIILSMMILPTVTSISKNAIEAVPEEFYLGALALGATKEQAMFRVEIPAAKSGITAALLLGIGRAVGETMAIIMVAGNRAIMPTGLFSNIRTLTINMVMEMAYATDLHKQALIATGVVLMVFIILLNLLVSFYRRDRSHIKKTLFKRRMRSISFHPYDIDIDTPRRQGQLETILKYLAMVFCIMSLTSLVIIVVFIFIKGMGHISLDLLFGVSGNAGMTLRPAFISTIMLISLALTLALPIGIGAAIYLVEYSKRQNKIIKLVRLATEVLSGVPSIVFGLFGMIFFCEILGFGYSLLAGGLTLALTILPTIIRATEESLLAVKNSLREGSYALGARKAQTIFKVIIPVSIPGIITAIILSIGRMVGESAALIFTSGAVAYTPSFYDQPGSSFAVMMWMFSNEGLYINAAYATAAVLMIIVIVINISIAVLDSKLKKRRSQ